MKTGEVFYVLGQELVGSVFGTPVVGELEKNLNDLNLSFTEKPVAIACSFQTLWKIAIIISLQVADVVVYRFPRRDFFLQQIPPGTEFHADKTGLEFVERFGKVDVGCVDPDPVAEVVPEGLRRVYGSRHRGLDDF